MNPTTEEQKILDKLTSLTDEEKLLITRELILLLFKNDIERNNNSWK